MDKKEALKIVRDDGLKFKDLPDHFKKDKEIVLAAIKYINSAVGRKGGYVLKFADDSLKKDKEVVLAAVKSNEAALEFADDSLKNDPDILKIINDKKNI